MEECIVEIEAGQRGELDIDEDPLFSFQTEIGVDRRLDLDSSTIDRRNRGKRGPILLNHASAGFNGISK